MRHPSGKFGSVVYRCMSHLYSHTLWQLSQKGLGDLCSHLDWDVQANPSLEDASQEEVRR